MTDKEALRTASTAARLGQLNYTDHALDEMDAANANERDVEHVCMTATKALPQPNGRWRLEGAAIEWAKGLTVVVAIRHGGVVITVF